MPISFGFLDPWPADDDGEQPDARLEIFEGMTRRQRDVAMLAAQGYAVTDMAATLGIGEETVRSYLKDLYRALGVHSRGELLRLVIGLDPPRCFPRGS